MKDYMSFPRAYGGVSQKEIQVNPGKQFSPCLRGCFLTSHKKHWTSLVFPVLTGVFLLRDLVSNILVGFPRAYGGVSILMFSKGMELQFSPCLRGCFLVNVSLHTISPVFPVLTGVFPTRTPSAKLFSRFPRAYGGVSVIVL